MKKIIIAIFITLNILTAANYESMGTVKKIVSIDLRMTDYGSSLGGKMQWKLLNNFHIGATLNWTFVSSGKEYTWTDPYTGYTMRINTIHLDFLKGGIFLKKHLFTRQLDNSFAPFLSFQTGPVLAIDTDNDVWANLSRYADAQFHLGFYAHFHFGIDFMMEKNSAMGVAIGYELNSFGKAVDEEFLKPSWNGAAIIINYGRYF